MAGSRPGTRRHHSAGADAVGLPFPYNRRVFQARMSLHAGTHLGPYEIEAPLGAGGRGMGEVYKARDIRPASTGIVITRDT